MSMFLSSMLRENVAIICIERSGTLPLTRCVSRVSWTYFASGHLIQQLVPLFNILSSPTISHPCIRISIQSLHLTSYHVVASTHLPSNIIQANCCPSSDGYPSRVVSKVILSNLVVLSSSGSSILLLFLSSQTKSIFVAPSPSHTELKQFLAEMNSPNFNRFDVGEGQLASTVASTSADDSNLSPEKEPVGGGGLEQVGKMTRVIVVTITIIIFVAIIIFVVTTNVVQGE